MNGALVVLWAFGVAGTGFLSTMAGVTVARAQLALGSRGAAAAWSIAAVVVCGATVALGLATVW